MSPCDYSLSYWSPTLRAVPARGRLARAEHGATTRGSSEVFMARRRGFFAEMAHQAAVADKNRQRAQAAAVRDQARRQREAERLQREYERSMQLQFSILEKEQRQARIAAQEAEVERLNGELGLQLADIDNVLSATLDV